MTYRRRLYKCSECHEGIKRDHTLPCYLVITGDSPAPSRCVVFDNAGCNWRPIRQYKELIRLIEHKR